ncbi:aryl-alcohol dehydrogenase-like predicted oxidoreductase [Actinokineospora baliensis]|uniref:aldo/keto reductase n=1 Tax=Actinokineospora baliensis TaxID=547056 RepID=UPI0019570EDF|nr:aldo/keto reductase [Actinokineospora baliensis]MBM7774416.1 aryl-alcohol dehydrogenase-like predicted oxidoreductase [Actinokineospora baliensis]
MIPRRPVGRSGLRVSALSLGAMTFGDGPFGAIGAEPGAVDGIVGLALDSGVDTFDTANAYGDSEVVLGKAIGKRRRDVVLCTKVRFPTGAADAGAAPASSTYGLSRSAVLRSVEESLGRLDTDWIDVLWLHMQDRTVPIEETLGTCDALVRAGKVRYIGVSNFAAYRATEAVLRAEARGTAGPVALQVPWSLVTRDVERELVPAAKHLGLGVLVYSPLARGFLSGKYHPGAEPPAGARLARWRAELAEYDTERNWRVLAALREIADDRGTEVGTVALAWTLARRPVASIVLGARTREQLAANLRAADLVLGSDERARLDEVSTPRWGYPCDFIGRFEPW